MAIATFAGLGAFPDVALARVEVSILSEDTHLVEVLVAVGGWLVVVLADAVSDIWYCDVYHTWGGVRVAKLGGATFAPWCALFV